MNVTPVPHTDYRGAYHAASTSKAKMYNCGPNDPCLYVLWPKPYWGSYFKGGDPAAGDWAGSLIRGQQDISGLMYRRNRYYDPITGQFTQCDPIGIASGLNTYGFVAGGSGAFPSRADSDAVERAKCIAAFQNGSHGALSGRATIAALLFAILLFGWTASNQVWDSVTCGYGCSTARDAACPRACFQHASVLKLGSPSIVSPDC